MAKAHKNLASKQQYLSQNQLTLVGFETPFACTLSPKNRWVSLAHKIPWDLLVSTYLSQMGNSKTGADGINPRVAIGSMIIKHICNLSEKWRSAMEAIISNIKRGFNIFTCNWKGWIHFQAKVLWSILAYNLRVMTGLILARIKPVPKVC